MFLRAFFPVLILAVSTSVFAAELDPLLSNEKLWTMKEGDFMRAAEGMGFRWTSAKHDSARAEGKTLTLFAKPLVEVIARFEDETLKEISVNIYTRGDSGEISKEKFEACLKQSMDSLSQFTNTKPVELGKDASNVAKVDKVAWQTPRSIYTIEYSVTKETKSLKTFRAEFIRLQVSPPPKSAAPLIPPATGKNGKFNGLAHVKRTPSGDVAIADVPMVDQGQKGYCAVATTERVMRYYGRDVDSNELAKVANSSSSGGTNQAAMVAAIKKAAQMLGIRVREYEKIEVDEILRLIDDYNRAAKKAKETPIPDPGHMININDVYRQMKPEVLRSVRTKHQAKLIRFINLVQSHVDQGIPIIWSVQLGLISEPKVPQIGGGHMRLIIGYNLKTQEILYSDSWGAGHEQKRMAINDAWTITCGELMVIESLQ